MINPIEVSDRVQGIQDDALRITGQRVSLIAVTKSFGCDAIAAAVSAHCDGIGENYAQEILEKAQANCLDSPVHFIGALQSNKIRQIAPYISMWQSVDRASVVQGIAQYSPGAEVLLQVNTTGETSKSGVDASGLEDLYQKAQEAGLVVRGLMTLGPTNGTRTHKIKVFQALRVLVDDHNLEICSMGMSDDYLEALECGATMLRIGSGLFGSRPPKQKSP
jgi:pyridoxal phosphate enzyme (YggS family)